MSFYGNTYSELQKYFQNINFIDSLNKKNIAISPTAPRDNLILSSGNEWIQLSSPNVKEIQFSHKIQNNLPKEGNYFTTTSSEDQLKNTPIELQYGSEITFPQVTYDKCGHIVQIQSKKYILPQSQTEQDYTSILERLNAEEEKSQEYNKQISDLKNTVSAENVQVWRQSQYIGDFGNSKMFQEGQSTITDLLASKISTWDNTTFIGNFDGGELFKDLSSLCGSPQNYNELIQKKLIPEDQQPSSKKSYNLSEALELLIQKIDEYAKTINNNSAEIRNHARLIDSLLNSQQ